ncbi:hypothetical protein TRFO_17221 [Tritrichomonas foetus]|uniref:Uncharacterized protein n=1 Tax=Tritrichomonas foetus TaxID=1144522 RepID=A0A1J4KNG0_9EUKA|nr:hypothetical protein TRFO_17221 [Tritrichomonas foetus]|eukprot:OHT12847.1 hypothetical protein TRFO_17221 [Tritrichomonas foetus]
MSASYDQANIRQISIKGTCHYDDNDGATPFDGDCTSLTQYNLIFTKPTELTVELSHDSNVHHSAYLAVVDKPDMKICCFDEKIKHFDLEVPGSRKEGKDVWKIESPIKAYVLFVTRYAINDESSYTFKISANDEFSVKEIRSEKVIKSAKATPRSPSKEEDEEKDKKGTSKCCLLI